MFQKIQKWWLFHIANPVLKELELGAFRISFRKFWLEISTASGNFSARYTAAEYPYGYLLEALNQNKEETVHGFCERIYMWSMLLLRDQKLADDMDEAVHQYHKRLEGDIKIEENEAEEMAALETEKQIQEYVEAPKKEKRKMERDANGRFKKAVRNLQSEE